MMRIVALLTGSLLTAAVSGAVITPAPAVVVECPAEVVELPMPPGATRTVVGAMNDRGDIAGYATIDGEDRIVLWRNGRPALDLGEADRELEDGYRYRRVVDVNDRGLVVLSQETRTSRRTTSMAGLVWDHGTFTRLRGTATRPFATVTSINDDGLAVGYLVDRYPYRRLATQPVVWRHGRIERLPLPAWAKGDWKAGGGSAHDITDRNLVVGSVGHNGRAWWWRLGGGHGSLRELDGQVIHGAVFADNRGRVIGKRPGYALWPSTHDRPHGFFPGFEVAAATGDGRYVTGFTYADRSGDQDDQAWLSTTTHRSQSTALPLLPGFDQAQGKGIGRGVTAYAPSGGVTVAGTQWSEAEGGPQAKAVLWTCAQTSFA